jgi:cell wall-associated NlpC family hydrolase
MLPGAIAQQAVAAAKSKLGRPYLWGAAGPDFFDCSGLVLWSYQQAGVNTLPRVANDQYAATASNPVTIDKLIPGDLLFFATDRSDPRSIHHVAMYVGGGYMIHAPTTGDVVKISPIWWSEYFGATRVDTKVTMPPAPPPPPAQSPPPSNPPSPPPSPTPLPTPSSTPPSPTPSNSDSSPSSSASASAGASETSSSASAGASASPS